MQLPLGASRNFGLAHAITGTRSNAVLEVEYYEDSDVDPTTGRRASYRERPQKLLRGTLKPLPAGVTLASPDETLPWQVVRVDAAPST